MNTCFVNASRLEFDAYKADYEALKVASSRDSAAVARYDEATRKFEQHRAKFEKLRADVGVKLQFLEENKVVISALRWRTAQWHSVLAAVFHPYLSQ